MSTMWTNFTSVYRRFSVATVLRRRISEAKKGDSNRDCPDPNVPKKPKKPLYPFLHFVNVVRAELLRQYPNAPSKEIIKMASIGWRKASEDVKKPFFDAYEKDRERYLTMMNAYEACISAEQKAIVCQNEANKLAVTRKLRFVKKLKKTGRPKRPCSAYNLFIAAKKGTKRSDESVEEWLKKIAYEWKNMPDIEKEEYSLRHRTILEQYRRDVSEWKAKVLKTYGEDPNKLWRQYIKRLGRE